MVSLVEGILSHYSFFMLSANVLAARTHSCWCPACSRLRGRGFGSVSNGVHMDVPGCERSNLTRWKERPRITVSTGCGQQEREKRQADVRPRARLQPKIALGSQGRRCSKGKERKVRKASGGGRGVGVQMRGGKEPERALDAVVELSSTCSTPRRGLSAPRSRDRAHGQCRWGASVWSHLEPP